MIKCTGEGQFSRVVQALDCATGAVEAVKVIRALPDYCENAGIEVDILRRVHEELERAGGAQHSIVGYRGDFWFGGHRCMVFEPCDVSLYDFLTANNFVPFSLAAIRATAAQLDEALAFLHRIGYIHTDLKPENVMLVHGAYDVVPLDAASCACPAAAAGRLETRVPRSLEMRLIDLGNAVYNNHRHSSTIGTRHYRPPEVLLHEVWDTPSDLWSVGCILVELYTGQTLFQMHNTREHLAMMERVLGPFPRSLLDRAPPGVVERYFDAWGRVVPVEPGARDRSVLGRVAKVRPLQRLVPPEKEPLLYDLISRMLVYEPERRITAAEAAAHPFCAGYMR